MSRLNKRETVLITGITGMIGLHVAKATREMGLPTYGIARSSAASRITDDHDPSIIRCDILDKSALEEVFKKIKPNLVIHMAAQAFNSTSWLCESLTQQTNYIGTANVLNCCLMIVPNSKVVLACSSAGYGDVNHEDCPLIEERLLRPNSPYGVSKVATENLGYQYYTNYGLKVYLPRLFIHVGTGHPPATAIQNFARQLALISKGKLEPNVKVGNLKTARDFIDVKDGVAAIMLLLEKGNPGEPINICTGEAWKIGDILNKLIKISGLEVEVIFDEFLSRPSDEPLLLGDNSKLKKLGWKRKYNIDQTLEVVYEDWIKRT